MRSHYRYLTYFLATLLLTCSYLFLLKIAKLHFDNFVVAFCFRYILNRHEATIKATAARGNYSSFLFLLTLYKTHTHTYICSCFWNLGFG